MHNEDYYLVLIFFLDSKRSRVYWEKKLSDAGLTYEEDYTGNRHLSPFASALLMSKEDARAMEKSCWFFTPVPRDADKLIEFVQRILVLRREHQGFIYDPQLESYVSLYTVGRILMNIHLWCQERCCG